MTDELQSALTILSVAAGITIVHLTLGFTSPWGPIGATYLASAIMFILGAMQN